MIRLTQSRETSCSFSQRPAIEYLVCGSGVDHMVNLLGIGRGWSGARGSDYSHPEALAKRGNMEGATEIYKEAIDILRTALQVAHLSANEEAMVVRRIHEICSTRLGDLARYLERQPEGEHGKWARHELIYIKERIR